MKNILKRRSIRKYTDAPVPQDVITDILKAGMAAPSAGNQQPWHFIVIDDKELLNKVPEFHPYSAMLMKAPAAILVCGDPSLEKHKGYWVQDCSAAVENMLIAIDSLGLGGVWLGVHPLEDREKGCRKLFGIPDDIIPFALISFGFPAEEKPPAERYDESRVHNNKW